MYRYSANLRRTGKGAKIWQKMAEIAIGKLVYGVWRHCKWQTAGTGPYLLRVCFAPDSGSCPKKQDRSEGFAKRYRRFCEQLAKNWRTLCEGFANNLRRLCGELQKSLRISPAAVPKHSRSFPEGRRRVRRLVAGYSLHAGTFKLFYIGTVVHGLASSFFAEDLTIIAHAV